MPKCYCSPISQAIGNHMWFNVLLEVIKVFSYKACNYYNDRDFDLISVVGSYQHWMKRIINHTNYNEKYYNLWKNSWNWNLYKNGPVLHPELCTKWIFSQQYKITTLLPFPQDFGKNSAHCDQTTELSPWIRKIQLFNLVNSVLLG